MSTQQNTFGRIVKAYGANGYCVIAAILNDFDIPTTNHEK